MIASHELHIVVFLLHFEDQLAVGHVKVVVTVGSEVHDPLRRNIRVPQIQILKSLALCQIVDAEIAKKNAVSKVQGNEHRYCCCRWTGQLRDAGIGDPSTGRQIQGLEEREVLADVSQSHVGYIAVRQREAPKTLQPRRFVDQTGLSVTGRIENISDTRIVEAYKNNF